MHVHKAIYIQSCPYCSWLVTTITLSNGELLADFFGNFFFVATFYLRTFFSSNLYESDFFGQTYKIGKVIQ